MRPKLILTDLDGTLLRDDKSLSPANRQALERAAAQGAQVVIATGRFYEGIPVELRDLPFLRYFILMNGAKAYDRAEDKVLYRADLDMAAAERVFDLLEPLDASMDCYQNDRGLIDRKYYDRLDYYIPDLEARKLARRTRTPLDNFREEIRTGGKTVQKIQIYTPHLELRPKVMEMLNRELPQLVLSISMPYNLEVNAPGATKGEALLALCRALSVDPAETVAFGDGTNDRTMLRCAGVGVAMANAAPETRAEADLVAPSNQEDGVAQVLSQWFGA